MWFPNFEEEAGMSGKPPPLKEWGILKGRPLAYLSFRPHKDGGELRLVFSRKAEGVVYSPRFLNEGWWFKVLEGISNISYNHHQWRILSEGEVEIGNKAPHNGWIIITFRTTGEEREGAVDYSQPRDVRLWFDDGGWVVLDSYTSSGEMA